MKIKKWVMILSFLLFQTFNAFAWKPSDFKKPDVKDLKNKLSSLQYKVTQEAGTEPPFKNEFNKNKEEGIYVDIVSGEPVFSSKDKFDSGTGWPSFTRPLVKENIVEKEDRGLFSTRTEVRSKFANSHLGHVFPDGPPPTGLRYCLNSASLRFIAKDKLKENGYEEFANQFNDKLSTSSQVKNQDVAIFAGGCFWCMQPPFDHLKNEGVISTTVGYTGGTKENPTYEETSAGGTGHRESVEVVFDATKISFEKLLKVFFANIDPYDSRGQFCDKGEQYTSAVFFSNEEQKKAYEKVKEELIKSGRLKTNVATLLLPAKKFYAAEEYHQSYYQKNPIRYKFYRSNCGRDKRLKEIWGQ